MAASDFPLTECVEVRLHGIASKLQLRDGENFRYSMQLEVGDATMRCVVALDHALLQQLLGDFLSLSPSVFLGPVSGHEAPTLTLAWLEESKPFCQGHHRHQSGRNRHLNTTSSGIMFMAWHASEQVASSELPNALIALMTFGEQLAEIPRQRSTEILGKGLMSNDHFFCRRAP